MEVGVVAMRYGKALLRYATDCLMADKVYQEMLMLAHSMSEFQELRVALDNPVLDVERKLSLLITAAGIEVSDVCRRFMQLILQRKREEYIHSIALMYIDLYRKEKNITVGRLITACPVSEDVSARIRQKVCEQTHGEVEFETKVDPAILGGFIFEVDTYLLDASVATQLKRVEQQFMEKNKRIV